ncbi:hypothetical protein [Endothiovibrio diazotrophicus]
MISIEDTADTLLPEFPADREPDYDGWLSDKVSRTSQRLDAGETATFPVDGAMKMDFSPDGEHFCSSC